MEGTKLFDSRRASNVAAITELKFGASPEINGERQQQS
jgi:hypothetical protein